MRKNSDDDQSISVRTTLILWFLVLSIVPIAVLGLFSLSRIHQTLRTQMQKQMDESVSYVESYFLKKKKTLQASVGMLVGNPIFTFHLINKDNQSLQEIAQSQMKGGRLASLVICDSQGEALSGGDGIGCLKDPWSQREHKVEFVEFNEKLFLSIWRPILGETGRTVGYVRGAFEVKLKELALGSPNPGLDVAVKMIQKQFLSNTESLVDFEMAQKNLSQQKLLSYQKLTNLGIENGEVELLLSGSSLWQIYEQIKWGFLGASLIMILLLIPLSVVISQYFLKPIYILNEAIEKMKQGEEFPQVIVGSSNELGRLARAYNSMSATIEDSQMKLEKNLRELKKTQSQLVHSEKMASLGQLVAGVAHELNNPIGYIYSNMVHLQDYVNSLFKIIQLGGAELDQVKIQEDFDFIKKDLPKLISACQEGSQRTRDIVLGLRNFSRLDESEIKTVDLHEGLEQTIELVKGQLTGKIEVVKNYGEIPLLNCYAGQLNQVFMNLVTNAISSIDGSGTITISTSLTVDNRIEIKFQDTGRGIDTEHLGRIFEPFFTTKTVGEGTGLGLSISYGIVEKHNGKIEVESTVGKGSVFRVLLPVNGLAK